MLPQIYDMTVGGALLALGLLIGGVLAVSSLKRLLRQGIVFGLIACAFLNAMATKPTPTPTPPYTVEFKLYDKGTRTGGGELEQTIETQGGYAVEPEVEARDGYEFYGWDTEAFRYVTSNMVVSAVYQLKIYRIEYQETKGAAVTNRTSYTAADEFVLGPLPDVPGFKFTGWVPFDSIARGTTGDQTVWATWEKVEEPEPEPTDPTVTNLVYFSLGERGVRTGGGELMQLVEEGQGAVAPEVAVANGYALAGWDRPFDCVTNSQLFVTAQYTACVYTVTYDDVKGQTLNPSNYPSFYTIESAAITPAALADTEEYRFLGWEPESIAQGSTGDRTFVAQWEKIPEPEPPTPPVEPTVTNEVRFALGDRGVRIGGGALVQLVEEGQGAVAPEVQATNGYAHAGWDRPFDKVTNSLLEVSAVYTTLVYSITYEDLKGQTLNPSNYPSFYTIESAAITPAALADTEEYRFLGWEPESIAQGSTGDRAFVATWEKIPEPPPPVEPTVTNEVRFALGDRGVRIGGGELVQLVEEGQGAVAPEVQATNGYAHAGWDRPFDKVTNSLLEVSAVYTTLVYSITYEDVKGQTLNPSNYPSFYTIESAAITPAALADTEEYRFLGWEPESIAQGSTGDRAFVATWEKIPEPEPPTPPVEPTVTNEVRFALGDRGVRIGGGELVQRVEEGQGAVAPEVQATNGYAHAGWDRPFDCVTNSLLEVSAVYTTLVYTVTYEDLKGQTPTGPATYTIEDAVTPAALADTEEYRFLGWEPESIAQGSTGDRTFVAQWEEIPEPEPEPPEAETWNFTLNEEIPTMTIRPETLFEVASDQVKSVTVKGLPTGLKYVAKTLLISGKPTKVGLYTVTLTAKLTDKSTRVVTRTAYVRSADRSSIVAYVNGMRFASPDGISPLTCETNILVGVYVDWPVAAEALSTPTVKITGLPSGLSYKNGRITGYPSAATTRQPSTVKIVVTTAAKSTQNFVLLVTVTALPTWATGTYAGVSYDAEGLTNGLSALTITKVGKLTAKQVVDGKTRSFTAKGFAACDAETNALYAVLVAKSGKLAWTNDVCVQADGSVVATSFDAWRYDWKTEPGKSEAKALKGQKYVYVGLADGTYSDAEEDVARPLGEDVPLRVTLKFTATGTATVSGEFATGAVKYGKAVTVKASGSTTLLPTEDGYRVFVYLTPKGLSAHTRCVEFAR